MFKLRIVSLGLMVSLSACGSREQKTSAATGVAMVHGSVMKKNEDLARSVVALVGDGETLCTGSILDEQTILTAAHCLDGVKDVAIIFAPRIKSPSTDNVRKGDRASVHPKWKRTQEEGDLALIHFSGGLPEGYGPVQLSADAVEPGIQVRMIGYGVTNPELNKGAGVLRETSSSVIDLEKGSMFVVDEKKSGACFGDSGGPAYAQVGGQWMQVGVTHSGLNESCDEASVYTDIKPYLKWIGAGVKRLAP